MTDTLEHRVARLERENRRLKRIGLCIITAVAVAVLAGARLPESARVVEAERFILRDKDGAVRAEWTAQDDGARLAFVNETGEKLLSLGARKDKSAWLTLREAGDKGEIAMLITDTGMPQFNLSHSDHGHVYLTIVPEGRMALDFLNRERQGLLALKVEDDCQQLVLADDDGEAHIAFEVNAQGLPGVGVADRAGTRQVELSVGQDRQPHLKWEGQDVGRLPPAR